MEEGKNLVAQIIAKLTLFVNQTGAELLSLGTSVIFVGSIISIFLIGGYAIYRIVIMKREGLSNWQIIWHSLGIFAFMIILLVVAGFSSAALSQQGVFQQWANSLFGWFKGVGG